MMSPTGLIEACMGFRIMSNKYMGNEIIPTPPIEMYTYKGRYRNRKIAKWKKNNPPYYVSNGSVFLNEKARLIICHPDDVERIRLAMEKNNVKENSNSQI